MSRPGGGDIEVIERLGVFDRRGPIRRPREPGAVAEVVRWLRASGAVVVPLGGGRFSVDGRETVSTEALIRRCNAKRAHRGLQPIEVTAEIVALCAKAPPPAFAAEMSDRAQRSGARSGARPWTDQDIATLRRLWAAGAPTREIADRLDRTPMSIHHRVRKLELPPRGRGWRAPASTVELGIAA